MKKLFLIIVAFVAFSGSGTIAHFYHRDDALSLRYILWKKGLHPDPSDIILRAVVSDSERNDLIRGKTIEEIKQIFSNVHEKSVNDYQRFYDKELKGKEYLWLGQEGVIIFLENGTGDYLTIRKG